MGLPESDKNSVYKTLNEDVKLKCDAYGKWDLDIHNGDYINTTGLDNCIVILLATKEPLLSSDVPA